MKRILLNIFTAIFMSVCMTACYTNIIEIDDNGGCGGDGGDGGNGGGGGNYYNDFVFSNEEDLNQRIFADAQIVTISFYAKTEWYINIDDPNTKTWLSVEEVAGSVGDINLQIYVDENRGNDNRRAYISLKSVNDEFAYIEIEQEKMEFPTPEEQPVQYENIVDKIVRYKSINGMLQSDYWHEWEFEYDPTTGLPVNIYNYAYSRLSDETISRESIGEFHAYYYDNILNLSMVNNTSIINKECWVNDQKFVKYEYFRSEINGSIEESWYDYFYQNDYLRWNKNDIYTKRFVWNDNNLLEYGNDYSNSGNIDLTQQSRVYTTHANTSTNIDLNYIAELDNDASLLLGIYGKRSQNLVSEINTENNNKIIYQYEIIIPGRVDNITVSHYFDGYKQETEEIYHIQYK